MISRKSYIGIMEMNGDHYEDEDLTIIDEDLFIKAQELRKERRKYSPMIYYV